VRKFAKLILLFSLTFIIIFALAACLRFLTLRVDWAKNLPPKPETALTLIISAAYWAMTLSLFSSVILVLNYAARNKCKAVMSIPVVLILSFSFCFGISFALEKWTEITPSQSTGMPLISEGLILSNALNKNETAVILLDGMPYGPRVTAIPGQPLTYQQSAGAGVSLPPVPFVDDTPWFLKSLSIDIRLNSEMFRQEFSDGLISFSIYAGSLIFLLCALSYTVKFSAWPLANLFLCALAFRGILLFNTFLNSPEMQVIAGSVISNFMPVTLAVPALFTGFGLLLLLFSLLSFAAKRRPDDD
jgi:hypothetical protein